MPRLVLSASRRTDIPAFYMPWFMKNLDRGYFDVINPYNRQKSKIPAKPETIHTIVFWSKNFGPFIGRGYADTLTRRGYNLFFNFTINSPHPVLEPMMPSLEDRLAQLTQLAEAFGPQSIQWRFDPICFYKEVSGKEKNNLDQFETIARRAEDVGVRTCITSFVDIYRKVAQRMKNITALELFDPPMDRKVATVTTLSDQLASMRIDLQLCCEKEVLAAMPPDVAVRASACIPNDRLKSLYGRDISLARDQGQRTKAGCQCRVSKDIGSYSLHPCGHNCLFCYANTAMDKP